MLHYLAINYCHMYCRGSIVSTPAYSHTIEQCISFFCKLQVSSYVLPWKFSNSVCIISTDSVLISATVCTLHIAVLISYVIVQCTLRGQRHHGNGNGVVDSILFHSDDIWRCRYHLKWSKSLWQYSCPAAFSMLLNLSFLPAVCEQRCVVQGRIAAYNGLLLWKELFYCVKIIVRLASIRLRTTSILRRNQLRKLFVYKLSLMSFGIVQTGFAVVAPGWLTKQ